MGNWWEDGLDTDELVLEHDATDLFQERTVAKKIDGRVVIQTQYRRADQPGSFWRVWQDEGASFTINQLKKMFYTYVGNQGLK